MGEMTADEMITTLRARTSSGLAREDAETFTRVLCQVDVVPPYIGVTEDGEIMFHWKIPTVNFLLSFMGDGTYSYFAIPTHHAPSCSEEAAPVTQPLPADLRALIQK